MEITKLKLVTDKQNKDQKTLTVTYKHPTKSKKDAMYTVEFPGFVHADLINAFKGLIPHFCLITEEVKENDFEDVNDFDEDAFEKYRVTSFSIAGKPEDPGITLTGYRLLSTGKAMMMNSPFMKFGQPEEGYNYMDEFNEALKKSKQEAQLYIDGNKYGPDPQLGLFNDKGLPIAGDEEAVTKAQILTPLTDEEKVIDKLNRENVPAGDADVKKITGKIGHADKEAMARVAEMDSQPGKGKTKGGRKKPQSADNKTGE